MAYDASMKPPRRRLSEQQEHRLRQLLSKDQLQPVEAGELAALARHGTPEQQQRARARRSGGSGLTARQRRELAAAMRQGLEGQADGA